MIYIYSPATPQLRLDLHMASSAAGVAQIFVDQGAGFSEQVSATVNIHQISKPYTYHFYLPVLSVKSIRIDPLSTPATIILEKISLSYGQNKLSFSAEKLSEWQAIYDLREDENPGENKYRTLQITGIDPQLLFNLPEEWSSQTALFAYLPMPQAWWLMGLGGILILLARLPQAYLTYPEISQKQGGRRVWMIAALIPVIVLWVLYHDALNNGFMNDDPCHMWLIPQIGLTDGFFKSEGGISPVNYTPLFTLSFGSDLFMFGLAPENYYWHQLLSFSIAVVLIFIAVNSFLPAILSSLVVSAFLASVAAADAAHFLMERHYIEGLGLAAAALFCFVQATRRHSYLWAAAGSTLYFLACLAKELYVPLVGLLPFLAVGERRVRLRMWIGYLLFGAVYIILRRHVLGAGQLVAGYGEQGWLSALTELTSFTESYYNVMQWTVPHGILALFGILIFFSILFSDMKVRLLNAALWTGAAVAPIIPVINMLSSRYVLLVTLLLYVAIGFGIQYRCPSRFRILAVVYYLLLFGSGLYALERYNIIHLSGFRHLTRAAGDFLLYHNNAKAVLIESGDHCLTTYPRLRQQHGQGEGPAVAPTVCKALSLYPDRREYFTYNNGIIEPDISMSEIALADCEKDMPLAAHVSYSLQSGLISWQVGPYPMEQGTYYIATDSDRFSEINASGSTSNTSKFYFPLVFRVRYIDRNGWQTTSPPLTVDLKQANAEGLITFEWQRSPP